MTCTVSGQIAANQISGLVQIPANPILFGQSIGTGINDVVNFQGLYLTLPGTYLLNFQARSYSIASAAFQVVHNKLDHFEFLVEPGGAASGVAFKQQPRFQLLDQFSNLILVPINIKARLHPVKIAGDYVGSTISSSIACAACAGNPVRDLLTVSTGIFQFTDLSVVIDDSSVVLDDSLGLDLVAYNFSLCEHLGTYAICDAPSTEYLYGTKINLTSAPFNVYMVSKVQLLTPTSNTAASRY